MWTNFVTHTHIHRAITVDNIWTDVDEWQELSAKIVADIRKVMNDTTILSAPLQAYIIPPVDAHQVCACVFLSLLSSNRFGRIKSIHSNGMDDRK